ncbi:MAG: RnfABCDGE type electron transport complex subunit G [Pseudomonadota bacterium]
MSDRTSTWRSALTLTLLAAVCAGLVATVYSLAAPRLAENLEQQRLARYVAVLADTPYDTVSAKPLALGDDAPSVATDAATRVYGVFTAETLTAMLIETTTTGYAGPIDLVIAVDPQLRVLGVRVLRHRETPGIGDFIEARRSDWIDQFDRFALGNPAPEAWRLTSDGGQFAAVSGATVTARAVVRGIRDALHLIAETEQRPKPLTEDP